MRRTAWMLAVGVVLAVACRAAAWISPAGYVIGTWGGDNAGLIATDSTVHVHIGCESGDADGPIRLRNGSFDTTGTFTVGAYPIGPGVTHSARFTGTAVGGLMRLTVVLTDTTGTFGPVTLQFGVEPRMGACPICATRSAIRRNRVLKHTLGQQGARSPGASAPV